MSKGIDQSTSMERFMEKLTSDPYPSALLNRNGSGAAGDQA